MPSQWALQYFAFLGGMQVQAAFAHFFAFAILLLRRPAGRHSEAGYSGVGCTRRSKGWSLKQVGATAQQGNRNAALKCCGSEEKIAPQTLQASATAIPARLPIQ
jgi:hypothetical protein